MFGIEWLKNGLLVEKETSGAKAEAEAISSARRRAPEVAARLPGREPDSFRLSDATGKAIGVYQLGGR